VEIDKLIEGADIVRFIKAQNIKLLGHIQRMDRARPTRKLLDWKPMGTRPVGRPRQQWQKDVMEDLKKLKIKNWKETAKDRRTWRDLAEMAKVQKGLQCKIMMMMVSKYANFESYIYYVALGNIRLVICQIMTRLFFLGGGGGF
jgi:hypothetical protein